jgi:hypothetical protein
LKLITAFNDRKPPNHHRVAKMKVADHAAGIMAGPIRSGHLLQIETNAAHRATG